VRILLVEDSDDLRRLFARILRNFGCDVVEAPDGPAALKAVAGFSPDLVVTDVMMPAMDGAELIRRLREMPGLTSIPVVAITADDTGEAERRARAAGAADFLLKPIDPGRLLERIGRFEDG
jgi:CheY-like chemotaxis protein